MVGDISRAADAFVDLLQRQNGQRPDKDASDQRDSNVQDQVRGRRSERHLGLIDDRDIVGADAAGHADFLVALQQGIIELAVGIDLALIDVKLDRGAVLGVELRLECGHLRGQRALALARLQVGLLVAEADAPAFPADRGVQLVDLLLQCPGRRIGRIELRQHPGVFRTHFRPLRAQFGHSDIGQGIAGCAGIARMGATFRCDPVGARGDQRLIEPLEVGGGEGALRRALAIGAAVGFQRDDVVVGREIHRVLLRLFQLGAQGLQPVLEEFAGIGGRGEFPIHARADEFAHPGIGYLGRDARRAAGIGDIDQPRGANGGNDDIALQQLDRQPLALVHVGRHLGAVGSEKFLAGLQALGLHHPVGQRFRLQ